MPKPIFCLYSPEGVKLEVSYLSKRIPPYRVIMVSTFISFVANAPSPWNIPQQKFYNICYWICKEVTYVLMYGYLSIEILHTIKLGESMTS